MITTGRRRGTRAMARRLKVRRVKTDMRGVIDRSSIASYATQWQGFHSRPTEEEESQGGHGGFDESSV